MTGYDDSRPSSKSVGVRIGEDAGGNEERIERAAIWHRGICYTVPAPGRHHDVILLMAKDYGLGPEAQQEQGFVTSTGRYVSRSEGWFIAEAAGQLLERAPTDHKGGTLYSEDVW